VAGFMRLSLLFVAWCEKVLLSRRLGGRGLEHVSADLVEGDVVLYRAGSWFVDSVRVGGPSEEAFLAVAVVRSLQLVFTATCEHGYIVGDEARVDAEGRLSHEDLSCQFGPEQVVSRLFRRVVLEEDGEDERLDDASLVVLEEAARALRAERVGD